MKQWSKIGNADSPACVPQDPGGSDFCDGIQFRGTSGIAAETENRLRLAEIIAETKWSPFCADLVSGPAARGRLPGTDDPRSDTIILQNGIGGYEKLLSILP